MPNEICKPVGVAQTSGHSAVVSVPGVDQQSVEAEEETGCQRRRNFETVLWEGRE
jgi:hypothetical protein